MPFEYPGGPEPKKSRRLGKALVIAAALHAPLLPRLGEALSDKVEEVRDHWKEGTIIHPQSKEEQSAIQEKVKQRESRIDTAERDQTKRTYREKLERGERVSFRDLYFDMEVANGVEPELVAKAEKKADSLILKYSQEANGEISDALIRRIVTEMYGADETYDWGQAGVSEYFVNGLRNCKSIAQGELIVFEGVVDRLPEDARNRYELGLRKIEQHEVATLGTRGQTYLLETSIVIEGRDADLAGTANFGLEFLKKGIVSEKPVFIDATGGKDIFSGPRLDVITNQPVDDGIIVQGKLRGSDYVKRIAEERGIVPEDLPVEAVTELEILPDLPTKEQIIEDFHKQASYKGESGYEMYRFLKNSEPSKETVAEVNTLLAGEEGKSFYRGVFVYDLRGWKSDAIQEVLRSPLDWFNIGMKGDRNANEALIDRIATEVAQMRKNGEELRFKEIGVFWELGSSFENHRDSYIDPNVMRKFFDAVRGMDEVVLQKKVIDTSELDPIVHADVKKVNLSRVEWIPSSEGDSSVRWDTDSDGGIQLIRELHKAKAEVVINGNWYLTQMLINPEMAGYTNIIPYLTIVSDEELKKKLAESSHEAYGLFFRVKEQIQEELTVREKDREAEKNIKPLIAEHRLYHTRVGVLDAIPRGENFVFNVADNDVHSDFKEFALTMKMFRKETHKGKFGMIIPYTSLSEDEAMEIEKSGIPRVYLPNAGMDAFVGNGAIRIAPRLESASSIILVGGSSVYIFGTLPNNVFPDVEHMSTQYLLQETASLEKVVQQAEKDLDHPLRREGRFDVATVTLDLMKKLIELDAKYSGREKEARQLKKRNVEVWHTYLESVRSDMVSTKKLLTPKGI